MNARWLEQLDEGDGTTRQRVQARFWQELTSAEPKEGVQAALAAAPTARSGLRRKLRRLLTDAALQNEAVFQQLLAELVWREGPAEVLARDICQEVGKLLEPAVLATRLTRALELSLLNARLLPELLDLVQNAAQRPCVELRGTLEPLQQQLHQLPWIVFDVSDQSLSRALHETITLVQQATDTLKDLPLPAAPLALAVNLPVPSEAQARGDEPEEATPTLWNRLRQRCGKGEMP